MILTQLIGNWEKTLEASPLVPFSDEAVEFFNDLSKKLTRVKEYPDVATFGFWCRKSALLNEKSKYDDLNLRLGKGIIFHSTPSNVPVNFAFSFAVGLLAGNANIVRLPGKSFEQVSIITDEISKLINTQYKNLLQYICFAKYPSDKETSDKFSSVCDVRVIWGGDGTINELRKSPLKPRATEITFADRYSIAVIHADNYLDESDKLKIAKAFYNDTYLSDQNACTSPRIIFWIGNKKTQAKEVFWETVRSLAEEKYKISPIQVVDKLTAFYKTAVEKNIVMERQKDNFVTRISVDEAEESLMYFKYNSGFYYEKDINDLKDIIPISGERLQTLTYFGISKHEIEKFFNESKPKGIDRAVPIGKSMDFTFVWDGYDLIRSLSRKVIVI